MLEATSGNPCGRLGRFNPSPSLRYLSIRLFFALYFFLTISYCIRQNIKWSLEIIMKNLENSSNELFCSMNFNEKRIVKREINQAQCTCQSTKRSSVPVVPRWKLRWIQICPQQCMQSGVCKIARILASGRVARQTRSLFDPRFFRRSLHLTFQRETKENSNTGTIEQWDQQNITVS